MAYTVLEEKLRRRMRRIDRAAEARGIEQGIERGMERGIEQGMERGIEQGMERGIEEGAARLRGVLRDLASRRFGAAAGSRAADLLAGVGDPDELGEAARWIVDSATAAEFLARLGERRGAS